MWYEPRGTIEMANDGNWCWVQTIFTPAGELFVAPMQVKQSPSHGELVTGSVAQKVRFAYRPKAGFVGTDSFIVNATTPRQSYDIPVTITVTP